jgi:hypothetical protein
MKKLMTLMLALSFMAGTVANVFAQDSPKKDSAKKNAPARTTKEPTKKQKKTDLKSADHKN